MLPAPYKGGTKTCVLSSMQNEPDGQPELCKATLCSTVESHLIVIVEFGQNRLTHMTRAADEPGWALTSVVLADIVKSKFPTGYVGGKVAITNEPLTNRVRVTIRIKATPLTNRRTSCNCVPL